MRAFAKIVLLAVAVGLAAITAAIAFSPFRRRLEGTGTSPRLEEAVDIAAPCARVFAYLGDSRHAHQWSVFINHITPLNPGVAADGAQGSIRRSFRNADEQGMRWDELFTIVEPDRRRQLRIFNIVDGISPRDSHLMTEQLYQPRSDGGCHLAFTVFFEPPSSSPPSPPSPSSPSSPSLRDEIPMRVIAYQVVRVFRRNIGNVKRLVEQGQ